MTRIRIPSAILNKDALAQPIDFWGMTYGRMMPTDLDAFMDVKGQAWVLIEVKQEGASWPRGQLIALERLANDLMKVRPVLAIRATHTTPIDKPVDLAKCVVHSYMDKPLRGFGTQWATLPPPPCTVRELVDVYVDLWGIDVGTA